VKELTRFLVVASFPNATYQQTGYLCSMESLKAPTTLLEFAGMFPTDESCAEYLKAIRWPHGFVCPKCGSKKSWWLKKRKLFECENGHQTSVTAGTVMQGTRTPMRLWFYGAFLIATLTPGISALQFAKQLGMSRYETAFQLMHKLRSSLVAPEREKLKGEVEIDEAFVGGKRAGKRGRGAEGKALVITAVEIIWYQDKPGRTGKMGHERGHEGHLIDEGPPEQRAEGEGVRRKRAGRVRMSVLQDAGAASLLPWVQRNVEKGTIVHTDGWKPYAGLAAMGYDHRPYVSKGSAQTLPMIHLIIANLKRWLMGTYKGAPLPQHLPAYLNEFVFRFNRRFWRGPAFHRALGLMTQAPNGIVTYKQLYQTGKPKGWVHPNPRQSTPRRPRAKRERK